MTNATATFGGALTAQTSKLTFSNSTFGHCHAQSNDGAMYIMTSDVNLDSVTLISNRAISGAGVYAFASTVSLVESTLIQNQVTNTGGSILSISSTVNMDESTCSNNSASKGACVFADLSSVNVSVSELDFNLASSQGGAAFLQGESTLILSGGCRFGWNQAPWGAPSRSSRPSAFDSSRWSLLAMWPVLVILVLRMMVQRRLLRTVVVMVELYSLTRFLARLLLL